MGEPESLGSLFKAFIEEVEPKLRAAAEKVERAAKPAQPVSAFDIQEARARIRKYWGGYHPEKPDVIDFALQALEYQNDASRDWREKFYAQQAKNDQLREELMVVAGERDRAKSDWKDAELRASKAQDVLDDAEKKGWVQTSMYQEVVAERDRAREVRADEVQSATQDTRTILEVDRIVDSFDFAENRPGNPVQNKLLRLRDEYRRLEGLIAHVHSVTSNTPTRPDNGSHTHGHPMATEKT